MNLEIDEEQNDRSSLLGVGNWGFSKSCYSRFLKF